MRPVVHVPHPALTKPAKTITSFDKRLAKLIAEMKTTLRHTRNPKGVGLAAPQIGESYRLFITRPTEKEAIRVFINPTIIKREEKAPPIIDDHDDRLEGCLSIPKLWGKLVRSSAVTLTYQDELGEKHTEEFTGFMATIIQHETDHTDGILFTQRVLEQHGKFYESARDENGKEVLDEVTIT